ncbi:glycosyltransferase family 4 protein [Novosphingobium mangrovi (ex Hu et al. 2023)]|uniref:Glycosyltransferase family 4 protein n=1 Tax=Novosphingobium mangrovi (ex Hu et al. 2023) TaxID=2930094 RepID=A0ABT0ACB2_9SPHN|nr:glycosyltransferase family 4 protein [Novosphingobium mangrovi (ex Hu et al. 2023)]MCJ1960819.1 glycosyltransferase family 4 protein [Novosphingobium mangrovi (ex Hu et al. 2023)]
MLTNTLFPPIIKGGAEVSTFNLGKALAERGHEMHVVTVVPDEESVRQEHGMTVHRIRPRLVDYPFDRPEKGQIRKLGYHLVENYNPLMRARLAPIMETVRPQIVHTNIMQLLTCGVWDAAKAVGAQVVHNLRDYWLLCSRSGFFRDGEPCSRSCTDCAIVTAARKRLTSKVDGVVAVGQYVVDTHMEAGLFPNARVARAILSATPEVTDFTPRDRSDGTIVIGFIGRIKESKGVRVLQEAMKSIPADVPVRLIIAGDGDPEYMAEVRALADERTEFMGWCTPREFYEKVDLVVVPSLYPEPLPRSILETYRFGLPVIAAKSGGIPEVVEEGRTGWLYEGRDVSRLAELICALPGPGGLESLDSEARQAIVGRTDADFVVNAYEEIYKEVLA